MPLDPTGRQGPTRGQAAGPKWRQSSRGLYVPSSVDATLPEQRILEAAVRLRGGAVTGWASCRMHRAAFFDGRAEGGRTLLPVPVNCGPLDQIRKRAGDHLLRDILIPDEIEWIDGVPCTVALRATFDVMRLARGVRAAVLGLDMMAAAQLVSLRRMRGYVDTHPARTGVQRARDALPLASEHSRSPQESRLRLMWVLDAGRPVTHVNRPLFDLEGRLLGYPDLLDARAGVVGEYDGEDHREARRHSEDVDREARFRDHRLEIVRVTGPDMAQPGRILRRIRSSYSRARRLPPEQRTWTLSPPPWWNPEPTLDELLDARDPAR